MDGKSSVTKIVVLLCFLPFTVSGNLEATENETDNLKRILSFLECKDCRETLEAEEKAPDVLPQAQEDIFPLLQEEDEDLDYLARAAEPASIFIPLSFAFSGSYNLSDEENEEITVNDTDNQVTLTPYNETTWGPVEVLYFSEAITGLLDAVSAAIQPSYSIHVTKQVAEFIALLPPESSSLINPPEEPVRRVRPVAKNKDEYFKDYAEEASDNRRDGSGSRKAANSENVKLVEYIDPEEEEEDQITYLDVKSGEDDSKGSTLGRFSYDDEGNKKPVEGADEVFDFEDSNPFPQYSGRRRRPWTKPRRSGVNLRKKNRRRPKSTLSSRRRKPNEGKKPSRFPLKNPLKKEFEPVSLVGFDMMVIDSITEITPSIFSKLQISFTFFIGPIRVVPTDNTSELPMAYFPLRARGRIEIQQIGQFFIVKLKGLKVMSITVNSLVIEDESLNQRLRNAIRKEVSMEFRKVQFEDSLKALMDETLQETEVRNRFISDEEFQPANFQTPPEENSTEI